MPRQASDDSTSVGKKCLRANVLLPDPLGPIRTTSDSLGILIVIGAICSPSLQEIPCERHDGNLVGIGDGEPPVGRIEGERRWQWLVPQDTRCLLSGP